MASISTSIVQSYHTSSSSTSPQRRLCRTTIDFDTFIRMEQSNHNLDDVHDFRDVYDGGSLFGEAYENEELSDLFIDQSHSSNRRSRPSKSGIPQGEDMGMRIGPPLNNTTTSTVSVADVSQKQPVAQTATKPNPTVTANVGTTVDKAVLLMPPHISFPNELCPTSNRQIPSSNPNTATGDGRGDRSAAPAAAPRALMSSDLSFPYRLLNLLNEAERYKFEDVVSWVQKGTAFLIHNEARFVAEILPLYFPNMKKIKSFRRQLSAYGFASMRFGPIAGAFYHKDFLRDDDDKILNIERKKTTKRSQGMTSTTTVDVSHTKVQHVQSPIKPSACPTGMPSIPGAVMPYPHKVVLRSRQGQGQGQGHGQRFGFHNLHTKNNVPLDLTSVHGHVSSSSSSSNGAQQQDRRYIQDPTRRCTNEMSVPFVPEDTWFEVQTHRYDPYHHASSPSPRYTTASSEKDEATTQQKKYGNGGNGGDGGRGAVDDDDSANCNSLEPVPFAPGFTWKRRQGQDHELEQQLHLHLEQLRHQLGEEDEDGQHQRR